MNYNQIVSITNLFIKIIFSLTLDPDLIPALEALWYLSTDESINVIKKIISASTMLFPKWLEVLYVITTPIRPPLIRIAAHHWTRIGPKNYGPEALNCATRSPR